jgi:hypothetical protein
VVNLALDPDAMVRFCDDAPRVLTGMCGVDVGQARAIGDDVLARARAFAVLSDDVRDVLMAPSIEEVYGYEPRDSSLEHLAAVNVVVRNSLLEEAHANGPVTADDIRQMTTAAVAPMSHMLAAGRRGLVAEVSNSPFAALDQDYPRAWACLQALAETVTPGGGPTRYRAPKGRVLSLPELDEQIETAPSKQTRARVQSGIDSRFDRELIAQIRAADSNQSPLFVLSLSRLSRNTAKLFRTLEMILARNVSVVTANYLLRSSDVWVRRGRFVTPDNARPYDALATTGLAGVHRKVVEGIAAYVSAQSRPVM